MNTYYTVARGRKILSKRGRAYKKEAAAAMTEQGVAGGLTGGLYVEMFAYPPDRRKRDLDNLVKPIFDSLTEYGLWDDDSQIDAFHIARGCIERGGRIHVTVRPVNR